MPWPAVSTTSSPSVSTTGTSIPTPDNIRKQTVETVTAAARNTVQPDHLVWIIVGDRAKIEAPLRELQLGELHLLDADGNPVPTS